MSVWPLRFRELADGRLFLSDDAGGYFVSDGSFLDRFVSSALTAADQRYLRENGHTVAPQDELGFLAYAHRWASRQNSSGPLQYLILVPTLRCNLSCTYCQVSRAAEGALGYDWTEDALREVLAFLDRLTAPNVKIEFQGGEPTLRLDLMNRVREFCRKRFDTAEFVVCTNLQAMSDEALAFLSSNDTYVSTSIDGAPLDHQRHRTITAAPTEAFFGNLDLVRSRVAPGHLSALPTIDLRTPPDIEALIDFYEELDLRSIYLRPVNQQGFARRNPVDGSFAKQWTKFHINFIRKLVERNFATGRATEEFHFVQCLRRILAAGHNGHVDLRNPSPFAADYLVIDYDGRLFPTDEARMMDRVGQIDLSIGDVRSGIDREKVAVLNAGALNNFDPDCVHCAFQPYCGSDPIDSISRYGRVDVPRVDTWFCQRHLALFDEAVRMIYSRDERDRFSLRRWLGLEQWPELLAPVHQ